VGIGVDAVGVEEGILPPGPIVPGRAPGRDRKVGPAIGGSKGAQIDVGGPAAVVVQEGVGGAGVPMTDDELVDRRRGCQETEGMLKLEAPVVFVPGCRIEPAGGRSQADVGETLLDGPREGAVLEGADRSRWPARPWPDRPSSGR
jgi:hypothetical protein